MIKNNEEKVKYLTQIEMKKVFKFKEKTLVYTQTTYPGIGGLSIVT